MLLLLLLLSPVTTPPQQLGLPNLFYLSLEVGRVSPFLSREGFGICDQMLPPDLTSLSTKFSFLHRIDTNLPTPAPTGSKRADARFPDPLLIPSRLDRDCNLERGSNNWPPTIGRWGGLRWIQWNLSLFRTPSHRPETYINHEFFRAGRQAGRTGTGEEVPQRAAATTLTPFMQLWTPRNFINSNATYPFGADVTNYASLPTKPT